MNQKITAWLAFVKSLRGYPNVPMVQVKSRPRRCLGYSMYKFVVLAKQMELEDHHFAAVRRLRVHSL